MVVWLLTGSAGAAASIPWQPWDASTFAAAKKAHRLILLDLEAVWCHWCHVMDAVTYQNPEVVKLLGEHVIAVKVDQDARPDLANRYEDYGWPATILFAADGTELAKRSGYLPPAAMLGMLKAFIAEPTPGPSARPKEVPLYAQQPTLPAGLRAELTQAHAELYDPSRGGWGREHKYLEWTTAEYALAQAAAGDHAAAAMLQRTLRQSRQLLDPQWGGVYQYSVGGDWTTPHYEKIMQFQAEVMRIYGLAYKQFGDPSDLAAAKAIERFTSTFMTNPDGAFFTSMDADQTPGEQGDAYFKLNDEQRRQRGIPRIDTHIYARENGWMIYALCELYAASGDSAVIARARRAAAWVQAHRALAGGGFRHADQDPGGPYLGDNLAMGRALLSLYLTTAERSFLTQSLEAAHFIQAQFTNPQGPGFITAKASTGDSIAPQPTRDEMVVLARYANLLARVSGDARAKAMADTALRFLATPAVARRAPTAGVLLAADEHEQEPVHITIVGAKGDAQARALFTAALRYPSSYLRLEWWDRAEGPLPASDVTYPELGKAAAFACSGNRCSLPMFAAADLVQKVRKLAALPQRHDTLGVPGVAPTEGK